MKKILSFLLVFIMIMSLSVPYAALAAEEDENGFVTYWKNGERVVGGYVGTAEVIEIPSEIAGKLVTKFDAAKPIGECVVNTTVKKIVFPDTIEYINIYMFRLFEALESIEVSENNPNYCTVDGVLYSKDKKTLCRYPSKKSGVFVIPATVEKLEYDAFHACNELLGVEVEEGNEYFASIDGVLLNKSKDRLKWFSYSRDGIYTVPEEVRIIENGATCNKNYLETLIIDHDVTVMTSAFSNCPALKKIVVLNGAHLEIGGDADAFYGTDNACIYLYNGSTVGSFAAESLEKVEIVECEGEFLAFEPLWKSGYKVYSEQNLLRFIKAQTSVKEFFENMVNADKLTLKDADGNEASEDALVGTGFTVSITDSQGNVAQSAKTVVDGDTDGDAKVNSRDIASLQKHILGNAVLEDEFFTAGDLKADSKLDSRDVASMQRIVAQ